MPLLPSHLSGRGGSQPASSSSHPLLIHLWTKTHPNTALTSRVQLSPCVWAQMLLVLRSLGDCILHFPKLLSWGGLSA